MRTRKSNMQITTRYRYDGQMGVEDLEFSTGGLAITKVTRYGLGARGIDVVSQTTGSGNAVSYPLYDTHGNNIGSLTSNGTTFTVGDERGYDAWGGVRSGIADGAARYCANIGHKQDDESGLIYMRARYYEPGSGRFVSEDPAMDGLNWFTYVRNSPVNAVDSSGMFIELLVGVLLDEFLNVADGSASAAAHSYAKSKIQDACSYWAGRLVGVLIESQIEDLYGEVTSRGFGFGNEKGSFFFDFDGKDHGGKIHVDTYGKIRHYVQSTCKSSNYRIDLFIKGLQDSLIK